MSAQGLSRLLRVLGAGATAIAVHDIARGLSRVPADGERPAGRDGASVDSELRFGSAWYAVAGLLMFRAGGAPEEQGPVVRIVSAGWLLAAVGRMLSIKARGRPHPIFLVLMALEIVIPGVLLPWQRAVERSR